jgi:hypothetical protein
MSQYEWWTDPSGGRHFGRVKVNSAKKAAVAVAVADIDDLAAEAVLSAPVVEKRTAPKRRAPAKKKSSG